MAWSSVDSPPQLLHTPPQGLPSPPFTTTAWLNENVYPLVKREHLPGLFLAASHFGPPQNTKRLRFDCSSEGVQQLLWSRYCPDRQLLLFPL